MSMLNEIDTEFESRNVFRTKEEKVEIKIEDLSMVYQDKNGGEPVTALKNVNLEIKEGEFISLLGPSGCGKTTLLRIIADLLQPSSGKVIVRGQSPREIRLQKKYGIVFQNPVLYDWRTVRRNVCMPMELLGMKKQDRTSRVTEMLDLVGLTNFGTHYPYELSGGMQQRVGIARALAINPEILLMDEPFSALDEFTREKLHEDLLEIWTKTKKTVVFVTHNISEAVFLSDKVVVLSPHPGRVSAVIDIDIPRPRNMESKQSKQFYDYITKIRNSFEGV
ncbi:MULTISPECIES: ABC transporter ATP-binding protein [Clostridium]|uniref:ABC transporter ATP-binding protein n=1 Tax=Clostridium TaxID=1485 RepID=UPI00098CBEBA|nr:MULTISPECIES: ABC transporter ATP-binding protein [Clostridium]MBA8935441.1 NitT/TauT family transport system ATP-binding protein [Clostridium beijerinckii]NOW03484.1 NitT/TauT family transport system ATP-binding protein [Clostridium beijerinckii]NRT71038.1 NitT/TauT family transport system ATP-binding protein [Clostridium beijerinckii]NRU39836.1 NitT/TauT family transport system ATP-binding protein [Clostridium beijerinckii]NSA96886.1 NitT/TauT family transport system ATP-binding protein [